MKKLLLIILLIIGFSYPQAIDTRVLYLLENYDFQQITTDSIDVDFLGITNSFSLGSSSIYVNDTFTERGASAHKSIKVDLAYTPIAAGAACPVGIASKVTLTSGMTYNEASDNYQGLAWAVQGQIHFPDGAAYVGQNVTDPGMIFSALRGILTDTGSSTYTYGTMTAAYLESQVSQDVTTGSFRHFLLWLRNQGSGTATPITAAIYIDEGDAWSNTILKGIDMEDVVVGIEINATTTGIDFQGAYSNAVIDFTDVTLDYTNSSGPPFIRAGTYGSPVSSSDAGQSGMIRLYGLSTATSDDAATGYYDRGIFAYLRTDGSKGIFPISGLAEVRTTSGDGPTSVMAGQFIAHLQTTGAKLATSAGDPTHGMYAAWFKIAAKDGATTHANSKKAPIWLDNSMYGINAMPGEDYSIYATSGGTKVDAFVGFETGANTGWNNMWYFDETSYDEDPIYETSIKVLLNTTQYYLPLSTTAPGYTFSSDLTLGNSYDDVQPTFSILGDADSDSGNDVSEIFALTLNPDATSTNATWDFTSTQSAGYTFDKDVEIKNILTVDSTMSIGGWGYSGEHFTIPETSVNTNAGLGVYSVVDYAASSGKVFAGTYNRMLAMTANQTNQSTMVGSENQFRLRDVDIGDGVHAGLWAYAEQSGTSELSNNGTFDAISATVESGANFTVGATEQITGITLDSSIDPSTSGTIDANTNFSAVYVKSNGLDWYTGLKITGSTTGIDISGADSAIVIGADGTPGGDLKAWGTGAKSTYFMWDDDANSFGRLIVNNASFRQYNLKSINETSMYVEMRQDETTSATPTSNIAIWGAAKLDVDKTNASSTSYAEATGIKGSYFIDGIMDGDNINVSGIKGEIHGSGTAPEVANIAAVSAKYNSAINPILGDNSLFWGWSHGGVVDYGLKLEATDAGSITTGIYLGGDGDYITGIDFDGISAGADVNYMSTDFDFIQGTISGNSYESRGNITGVRTDVTAIGNIDHVWALRSGASMEMEGDSETNQFYGGIVSVSASGAHTLTLHDGLVGLQTTVSIDAGVTEVTGGLVAALFTNSEPIHLDVDSPTYNIYAKVGGYTDYGIAVQVESNNVTSGIRIKTIDSAILPVGLEFEDTSGNIKADIKLSSGAFIFSGSAANGNAVYAEVGDYDAKGSIYLSTVAGALYIQIADNGNEADWYKADMTNTD